MKIQTTNTELKIVMQKDDLKEYVHQAEDIMKNMQTIEVPVAHYFSKDVYAREMTVTKGSYVVGKIHKYQNLNILSQGEVSIISIDGVIRIKAPYTFVASPGAKRLFYAHEDSVWTVIHGTAETNVEEIEKTFITESYEDIENLLISEEKKCLG